MTPSLQNILAFFPHSFACHSPLPCVVFNDSVLAKTLHHIAENEKITTALRSKLFRLSCPESVLHREPGNNRALSHKSPRPSEPILLIFIRHKVLSRSQQ